MAQLVFVPFLMGISEVGTTPRRPSSSSTAAVADVVPQNGLSLVAGSWWQFDTASARWWPEPRLHGSASVCTVPDGHFGGCVRAAGPQQQRYRRSGSQRTQIRLESALCRRSTSILARSSRNGPLGAVSLATLGGKTAVRPVNDPIIPRDSAAHPRGEWPRGALDRAAHCHRVRNRWSDSNIIHHIPYIAPDVTPRWPCAHSCAAIVTRARAGVRPLAAQAQQARV